MNHDIYNETPLIPEIIADRAAWTVIESDKRYTDYEPMQIDELVKRLSPALCEKAQRLFNDNTSFRKLLLDGRKDCRYTLEMFMEHWTKAFLWRNTSFKS